MTDFFIDGQARETDDVVGQAVIFPPEATEDDADENHGVLLVRDADPRRR